MTLSTGNWYRLTMPRKMDDDEWASAFAKYVLIPENARPDALATWVSPQAMTSTSRAVWSIIEQYRQECDDDIPGFGFAIVKSVVDVDTIFDVLWLRDDGTTRIFYLIDAKHLGDRYGLRYPKAYIRDKLHLVFLDRPRIATMMRDDDEQRRILGFIGAVDGQKITYPMNDRASTYVNTETGRAMMKLYTDVDVARQF